MKENFQYIKSKNSTTFADISGRTCFYSNGVLYIKILQSDLDEYGIDNVNAVSILGGGLTKFDADEEVYVATCEHSRTRDTENVSGKEDKKINIKKTAHCIADVLNNCGFDDVTDSSGYYIIKEFPDDTDRAVDVHKSTLDGKPHYVIYCSFEDGNFDYVYTDDLSVESLIDKLEELQGEI